jgi:hypothetical protein
VVVWLAGRPVQLVVQVMSLQVQAHASALLRSKVGANVFVGNLLLRLAAASVACVATLPVPSPGTPTVLHMPSGGVMDEPVALFHHVLLWN